jgi:hypothetical protein
MLRRLQAGSVLQPARKFCELARRLHNRLRLRFPVWNERRTGDKLIEISFFDLSPVELRF